MTKIVSKEEFEAFVAANAAGEAEVERDTEYSYENFHDADGKEIAFAAYHSHKGATYQIREEGDE